MSAPRRPDRRLLPPLAGAALACALAAPPLAPAAAEDLDGRAIVDKADKANRPKDETDRLTIVVVSARGLSRQQELTSQFLAGAGDDDRLLVRFDAPPEVKGTGLLTIERGAEDEQWLYLPELKKSKRIAGAAKAQSFMGTDFSHYDMRTEDLAGHDYEKVGEEEVAGRACYVVEAKPRSEQVKEATGYARRRIWIDKERFALAKVEYFDRKGEPLKTLTTEGWKQMSGVWRSSKQVMENKQEGSKTVVTFEKGREINKGIAEDNFTKRQLEAP